jgi:hypothetical protein
MANEETTEQCRRMLEDIRGMCDEVEYMVTIGELNLAENLAFADSVANIAARMQETVAFNTKEHPEWMPQRA